MTTAQAGGLWVRPETMSFDHGADALDRRVADALLFGLAVDHVAGGGHRNTGQTRNITEFQAELPFVMGGSLRWIYARRIFTDSRSSLQQTLGMNEAPRFFRTLPTAIDQMSFNLPRLSSNVPAHLD
jgi:hypothetical protein